MLDLMLDLPPGTEWPDQQLPPEGNAGWNPPA